MSSALFYVAFWAWNLETLGFQDFCNTVFYHEYLRRGLANRIDPFHKWLPIINSFVIIKISLTNLVFELTIQKNFYSQTRLVRLILIITKEFIIGSHL